MTKHWLYTAIVWCTIFVAFSLAEDDTAQKANPLEDKTTIPRATQNVRTPKPTVDVINSALCKKCSCDKDIKQLDCSNKSMKIWFNDEEWNILQNGDLTFEIINLEHNQLTEIPQLRTYPVKHLYLGFNKITKISIGAFRNLTELTKLDLSHNKLTSKVMVPGVFKGQYAPTDYLPLGKMRELNLGYNELHNLDPDLFEHIPYLEVLILCKNLFRVIGRLSEIAIASLTSLKTLDLSYMELEDLPDYLLHGPRDLKTLILTGNLFDEIPDNMELAINLKRLVFDENPIKRFSKDNVFPALRSLQYLSISYLPELKHIGRGALSNLQNLTELIIINNPKLSSIDANAFAKSTANPEIFDYPPLEKLYLHNNNLTILEHDLLKRWDKIKVIDLRNNPWDCDCTNSWLIHTILTQINATTPILTKGVNCNLPVAWKNVPVMDLNSNKKQLICNNNSHPESDSVMDLNSNKKQLICNNDCHPECDSLILFGLLVGILVGIPLTLGTLILYRLLCGCFGLCKRSNTADSRALYNHASSTDDFHI